MIMGRRRVGVAVFVLTALLSGVASVAWACTAQPRIVQLTPLAAAPGSDLSLQGDALAANAPVELRWNALDGQVIGTAVADDGGEFATTAVVPDAAPGVYAVIAVSEAQAVARTAFEVTGPVDPAAFSGSGDALWQADSASELWADEPMETASDTGVGLQAALVLLSIGLTGLLAASLTAVVRRRRAMSHADTS